MTKSTPIQFIRVVAMFMIITDHILELISFPMRSIILQIANSGVFIFLFISGYLFGRRHVDNWCPWFKKRIVRIMVPLWVFMIADYIVEYALWRAFDIKIFIVELFNLQGIFGTNYGSINLWFLTLIMICYIITPLLQKIRELDLSKQTIICICIVLFVLQIVLAYITDIGMIMEHSLSWCLLAISVYAIGYYKGDKILGDFKLYRIIKISIVTFLTSIIVFLANYYFDGQIIYDRIIAIYGFIIFDYWACVVLYKLGAQIHDGVVSKILNHLDMISYEFYIVHGFIIFIVTINVLRKFGVVPYIIISFLLSYIAAWILHGGVKLVLSKENK